MKPPFDFIKDILKTAKSHLEKDGFLTPVIFVGKTDRENQVIGDLRVILPKPGIELDTEEFALFARRLGRDLSANFALTLLQGYSLALQGASKEEIEKAESIPLHENPDAIEIIGVMVETPKKVYSGSFPVRVLKMGEGEEIRTFSENEEDWLLLDLSEPDNHWAGAMSAILDVNFTER